MKMTPFERCIIPPAEVDRVFVSMWQGWQDGHPQIRAAFNATPDLAAKLMREYILNESGLPVFKKATIP